MNTENTSATTAETTRQRKATVEFTDSIMAITFAPDGTEPTLRKYDLAKLNEDIQNELLKHGAKQKLTDSFAGIDLTRISEAVEKVDSVWSNLLEGNWRAAGGGSGGPRTSLLAEAIARVTGKTVEECAEKLAQIRDMEDEDQSKEILRKLRNDSSIKKATLEIKQEKLEAERAAAEGEESGDAVDLSAMF